MCYSSRNRLTKLIAFLGRTLLWLIGFASISALAVPGDVVRISEDSSGVPGNGYSYTYKSSANHFSADGRYVVFYSYATNLLAEDTDSLSDIYLYDRQLDKLELVSRNPVTRSKGNANSAYPSISADGRYVVFSSNASNLHADDSDQIMDIFLYDRQLNTMKVISRNPVTGNKGNNTSAYPSISTNGRYVTFSSFASNLNDGVGDSISDIYVYDLQDETLKSISYNPETGLKGNYSSYDPAISADGRYVVFQSLATNLSPGDTDVALDIYLFDRQSDSIELISRPTTGAKPTYFYSYAPASYNFV